MKVFGSQFWLVSFINLIFLVFSAMTNLKLSAMDEPPEYSFMEELTHLEMLEQEGVEQSEKLKLFLDKMVKYLPCYAIFFRTDFLLQGIADIFKKILAILMQLEGFLFREMICIETPEKFWNSICYLQPLCDQTLLQGLIALCLADAGKSLLDVKESGPRAQTILHWMCSNNRRESISIVATGDKLWGLLCAKDSYGDIPLFLAVVSGKLDFVAMLIAAADSCQKTGELIVMTGSNGNASLHLAAQGDELEILKLLVNTAKRCGVLSDFLMMQSTIEQRTALHAAAEYNCFDQIDELCQAACDCGILKIFLFVPRSGNGILDGNTALHQAAYFNHVDAVEILLKWACIGRSIDEFLGLQNHEGYTASAIAKKMGHKRIVKILKNSKKNTRKKCCIQ